MISILNVLRHLPDWTVYLSLVVPVTVLVGALPYAGQRFLKISGSQDRSRGAIEAFKAIVASLAFLLAFTLAQAQSKLRADETLVAQEAAALNTMDRSLLRYNSEGVSGFAEIAA